VRGGDKIDPDTVFQLASLSKQWRDRGRPPGGHQRDQLGHANLPAAMVALSDPTVTQTVSVGDMFSHARATEPQATCWRSGYDGVLWTDCGSSARAVPNLLRLHQLWVDSGAEAVARAQADPGRTIADEALFRLWAWRRRACRFADYSARPDRAVRPYSRRRALRTALVRDGRPRGPRGGASSSATT